jgi:uncharacterized protein
LDTTQKLSPTQPTGHATFAYQADAPAQQVDDDSGELRFEYSFSEASYMIGYSKAVLYLSCADHDDMDVFVQLRKADQHGKILQNFNIPIEDLNMTEAEVPSVNTMKYLGPSGIVRASHRELDDELSTDHHPVLSHRTSKKISPGTIVKLEIGLWPTSILFDKGEKLVLKISGHHMMLAEFEPLRGKFSSLNKGQHVVHTGAEYQSMIQIPMVDM